MDEAEILRRAVAKWGTKSQINVAIEECGELIVVLAKEDRDVNGSTVEEITEEMADVEVMLEQLKIIFDNRKQVEEIHYLKVRRLWERLVPGELRAIEGNKITEQDYNRAFDKR